MFQYNLGLGVSLAQMVERNPHIARSIQVLMHKIIEMIHAESFKPDTVQFNIISPRGEPNKIFINLISAAYTDGSPLVLPKENPADPSYRLTSTVKSLYQAVVQQANSEVLGFLHCCPGLCEAIYAVTHYIYIQHYQLKLRDMSSPIVWDVYDHWLSGDLVITGVICA